MEERIVTDNQRCTAQHFPPLNYLLRAGFSNFQILLATLRRQFRVHPSLQICFFDEITPALMAIRRCLAAFEIRPRYLCIVPTANNLDNSGRSVGTNVVTDDGVGGVGTFVCQRSSVQRNRTNLSINQRAGTEGLSAQSDSLKGWPSH